MALQSLALFGVRSTLRRSTMRVASTFRMFSSTGQDIDAEDEALLASFYKVVPMEHRPPIKIRGVAANFATAAYTSASQEGTLDELEAGLEACRDLASKDSIMYLKNPLITSDEKDDLLDAELGKRKIGETTGRVLKTLIENKKFHILNDVVDNFGKLMRAKRGEVIAIVTSADKLSKGDIKKLKKGLEDQFEGKKTVLLEDKVDKSILGGLMIDIDDSFADLSVRTALFDEHFRRQQIRP